MRPSIDPTSDEWLSGRAAGRLIGCSATALVRAALIGLIRVKLDPGIPPRYHRADVEVQAQKKNRERGPSLSATPRSRRERAQRETPK